MEVDCADEAEGRLAEPSDADSSNPEQYYLPLQLGWIQRRIEAVRGRDVPCQWRCALVDRATPPVRPGGGAADPHWLIPVPPGIEPASPLHTPPPHHLQATTP